MDVGGATPEKVVLGCIKKAARASHEGLASKQCSFMILFQLLPPGLPCLSSSLGFLQLMGWEPNLVLITLFYQSNRKVSKTSVRDLVVEIHFFFHGVKQT